jgi:hypothetical protein
VYRSKPGRLPRPNKAIAPHAPRYAFVNLGIQVLITMSNPEMNLGKGKIRL